MTEKQLKKLLEKLTLDEKIDMIHGESFFRAKGVPRLGIPAFTFSDGPMGVRPDYEDDEWEKIGNSDDYSSYLMSNTALASTFNRKLAYETGKILGAESRARGKDMILGPGVNIQRSPLCGRNFEYFSEDPYLSGEMAAPYIKGVQENDVSACVKHYAVNNQELARNKVDTYVSDRALYEIYLPAFRKAVEAGTLGIMGSYNKLRGSYCSHHPVLVDQILRKDWKFDGIMVSDWGSVMDTVEGGNSGIDSDMRTTANFDQYPFANPLKKAIADGLVPIEKVDEKVYHILNVMNRLHMLDGERKAGTYNAVDTATKLQKAAEESIVLLKNDKGLLPLNQKKVKKLLVIGDNANRTHALGGGSAEIKALYEVSPLLGLKMFLGGNTEVRFEQGYYCYVIGSAWEKDANSQGSVGGNPPVMLSKREIAQLNKIYLEDAIEACKEADAVIFIGGINHDYDVEGKDKSDMRLPNNQDQVIKELLKVRPDMIVTMMAGSPVDMHEWADDVNTLLTYSYNGMRGGYALAEVLFGACNPSGKLPVTFPLTLKDSPAHKLGTFGKIDKVNYKEDIYLGYRFFDTYDVKPAFAFGHGLSYTRFKFGKVAVEMKDKVKENITEKTGKLSDLQIKVSLPIKNTGSSDGACTALFFVRAIDSKIERPNKELKGFDKQMIKKGEEKTFTAKLDASSFAYYDEGRKCFVASAGTYEICVAFAADDVRSVAKVKLTREYCGK